MKRFRVLLLSVAIVAGFGGFGVLYADHPFRPPDGLEAPIAFGALGIGASSCLCAGFLILRRVREGRMPRYLAAVLLLWSSALSVVIPAPFIGVAARLTRDNDPATQFHLFFGERAMWGFAVCYYGFWIALAAFLIFGICVFTIASTNAQQGACT